MEDELSHGIGKCTFDKESVYDYYEGEWKKGKKSGQGKLVWKNGQVYEGGFENDQRIDWFFSQVSHELIKIYVQKATLISTPFKYVYLTFKIH